MSSSNFGRFTFKTVLAVVSGRASDEGVLAHSVKLTEKHKGNLVILYVIRIDRSLPIDAEVTDAVQKAENVLQSSEKKVKSHIDSLEAEIVQSREVGYAVVEEAIQRRAEVIVLGTEFTTAFGKFHLDEDVEYVLGNSHCRVVLLRGPVETEGRGESDNINKVGATNG